MGGTGRREARRGIRRSTSHRHGRPRTNWRGCIHRPRAASPALHDSARTEGSLGYMCMHDELCSGACDMACLWFRRACIGTLCMPRPVTCVQTAPSSPASPERTRRRLAIAYPQVRTGPSSTRPPTMRIACLHPSSPASPECTRRRLAIAYPQAPPQLYLWHQKLGRLTGNLRRPSKAKR